ncbi:MAG TPA: amino acid adenylation domain-containing protein, partial [Longimicrobiaceae bacterium]|nr:amino acid adenylation domain-containing protein [Longimicrobiaceae bacterium]
LMRFALFRTGEEEHAFVWTHHHLVADGWSMPLILREVLGHYAAAARGEELRLPAARPYADYIGWLRGRELEPAEAFWRRSLAGFAAPTPLGIGRVDGPAPGDGYVEEELELPEEPTLALRDFSRRHQVTPNTLVQGAWGLLLSRYSGEDDVLFGAVVSGRPAELEGVEEMVGLFINTLPVRVRVPDDTPVVEWLRRLQAEQADARQYDHTPLARVQGWSEVPQGTPLFETLLAFESYPVDQEAVARERSRSGLELRGVRSIERTHYAVTLTVAPGRRFLLRATCDGARLDAPAVRRMLGHLGALLEGILAGPERRVGDLSPVTAAERARLLGDGAATPGAHPRGRCIHEIFSEQAARTPDAVAVRFEGESVTYAGLERRANRLARLLAARGAGPETRVGVHLERSVELVVALLGVLKAGGAYVPLDPSYPPGRLAWMLEDAGVAVLLTRERLRGTLPAGAAVVVSLDGSADALPDEDGAAPAVPAGPESLAYVIYTSGSTGTPRAVAVPHRAVVRLVRGADYADLGPGEVFLQLAPVSFDAATLELWGPLLNGGRLVVHPPHAPSPDELGEILLREGVSTLWLTAGLFHLMVDERVEGLRGVRQLLAGGDVLSPAHVLRALRELPGCRIVNGYGPTENTTFTCCHTATEETVRGSVPVGRPIAGTAVYLLDRGLEPVPVGVAGELYAGGEGVARGYLGRPELTAGRFVPDPFSGEPGARMYRTGDRARWREDGTVEFLGRADRQVKVRGFRIEPGEVEEALRRHEGVLDAVVVARDDLPGQRRLVAYLTGQAVPAEEVLRERLGSVLPEYMVPSAFVVLDALPLTPSGKVDRGALPAPEGGSGASPGGYTAPRTPAEEALAGIWAEVLGVEKVGVHDGFFALGGDSILAIQVVARANRAEIRFTPKQLFEQQTVAALAGVVGSAPAAKAEEGPATGEVGLTPVQHWFLELGLSRPQHFNQAVLLEVRDR